MIEKIEAIKKSRECTIEEYAEVLNSYKGKTYVNEWGAYIGGEKWPGPKSCYNTQVNIDTIKHLEDAVGGMNPLYRDINYCKTTKYGTLIAPPSWPYTIVYGCFPEVIVPKFSSLYAGESIEWYLPVADEDEIDWRTTFPTEVTLEESKEHGPMVVTKGKHEFKRKTAGLELCKHEFTTCHFEMAKSTYQDSLDPTVAPEYTEEFIQSIFDQQDAEKVRGAVPRYWEDVVIGETMDPVVRGPFTVMESAAWLNAAGQCFFTSDRMFRFVHENTGLGYYDPKLKVWFNFQEPIFDDWGTMHKRTGSYVPGGWAGQRSGWAMHMISNWMGDEGFLWKYSARHLAKGGYHKVFWTRGAVVGKGQENGRFWVDIDLYVEDETGRRIMTGDAKVLLPSKEAGGVLYPRPEKPFGRFFE